MDDGVEAACEFLPTGSRGSRPSLRGRDVSVSQDGPDIDKRTIQTPVIFVVLPRLPNFEHS